jgi:hypothetical protein
MAGLCEKKQRERKMGLRSAQLGPAAWLCINNSRVR